MVRLALQRLRAGVAIGGRATAVAMLEEGRPRPYLRMLAPAEADRPSIRASLRRARCRHAIVAPAPEDVEVLAAPRGALTPREFERSLELEATRWDLLFPVEDAYLATEARARPELRTPLVGVVSRAGAGEALRVAEELGLRVLALAPDTLAYEALLRAALAPQERGEAKGGAIVLELFPGLVLLHAFDRALEARARRAVHLGSFEEAEAATAIGRELRRTLAYFECQLQLGPIATVYLASEAPISDEFERRVFTQAGTPLSRIDLANAVSGTLPSFVPATSLRAIGLGLLARPRIDFLPRAVRMAERLVLSARAALALSLAAALAGGFSAHRERAAAAHARARIEANQRGIADLAPLVRRGEEARRLREEVAARRAQVARIFGPRVALARLLDAVHGCVSSSIFLDAVDFRDNRIVIGGFATGSDGAEARRQIAAFVDRLERTGLLANTAARASDPPLRAGKAVVQRFEVEASALAEAQP